MGEALVMALVMKLVVAVKVVVMAADGNAMVAMIMERR